MLLSLRIISSPFLNLQIQYVSQYHLQREVLLIDLTIIIRAMLFLGLKL